MYGVIYKITNKLNGKPYIGQTTQRVSERFRQHCRRKNTFIGQIMRDFKIENFTIEVIEECETQEQLNRREIFWIKFFNCKAPNGYNLTDGGEGFKGLTEESLTKMRKPKSPEAISRMSAAQKIFYRRRLVNGKADFAVQFSRKGCSRHVQMPSKCVVFQISRYKFRFQNGVNIFSAMSNPAAFFGRTCTFFVPA